MSRPDQMSTIWHRPLRQPTHSMENVAGSSISWLRLRMLLAHMKWFIIAGLLGPWVMYFAALYYAIDTEITDNPLTMTTFLVGVIGGGVLMVGLFYVCQEPLMEEFESQSSSQLLALPRSRTAWLAEKHLSTVLAQLPMLVSVLVAAWMSGPKDFLHQAREVILLSTPVLAAGVPLCILLIRSSTGAFLGFIFSLILLWGIIAYWRENFMGWAVDEREILIGMWVISLGLTALMVAASYIYVRRMSV